MIWLFLAGSSAIARDRQLIVSLFAAAAPLKQVYLSGPFKLTKPSEQNLNAKLYRLSLAAASGKTFLLEPLFSQAGKDGSDAALSRSSGLNLGSYQLEISPLSTSLPLRLGVERGKLRTYRGKIRIVQKQGTLQIYNLVSMRDYLLSVVGSESQADFPLEALKAQAVLARTSMERYKTGDLLNDSTEKQAYLGADWERPAVQEAVDTTAGETVRFNCRAIKVFFHSCCAGSTSSSQLFTGLRTKESYDQAVPCKYCRNSSFYKKLTRRVPVAVYKSKFPEGIPSIRSLDGSGRPLTVVYPGSKKVESGYAFWLKLGQRLGWDKMPGTRFELKKLSGGDLELTSSGAGHGVGLCQWGASGMAGQGHTYVEILKYYFPGTELSR